MSITPGALEEEFSLSTAVTRLDFLSRRDSGATTLNTVSEPDDDDWSALRGGDTSLDVSESLELLALGEVVSRKAHDSQLVGFRAALRNGATWEQIAAALDVSVRTIERVREAWVTAGLEAALYPKPARAHRPRKLDGAQEAQLVALACSAPPTGQKRWTMRLLANRLVELEVVDRIAPETVRQTLKKTSSSRG